MGSISKFIERMDYYCRVASVGYDWGRRWNVWDGGDTDCSALVITCLREAGFDTGNAATTHNLSSELCARGWVRLAPDLGAALPGDILLNDANHVAAVLWGEGWGATVGQASIGETGGVYGNEPGDQTGWETNETGMYDYPWDCILRCVEHDESEDDEMGIYDVHKSAAAEFGDTSEGNMSDRLDFVDWRTREAFEPHESVTGDGTVGGLRDRVEYIDMRTRDSEKKIDAIGKQTAEILKLLKKGK